MAVTYLSVAQVLELHEAVLNWGGIEGLRSEYALKSAVLQPQQGAFTSDACPGIPQRVAAYAFFLSEAQPFMDGNKRTAAVAMLVFLELNGFEMSQADDEIAEMLENFG